MTRRFRQAALGAAALLLSAIPLTATTSARAAETPVVAAASSLQFAMPQLVAAYEKKTGAKVRVSYGASGNLARQVRQGAPFGIFMAADESYVLGLAKDGLTEGKGDLYGVGQLVIVVPKGSPLKADGSLADLKAALADGRLKKFAIANPAHAPYGERARETLKNAGLWDAIKPHLVFGENISQAAQFALSGATQGGLIAYSLALQPKIASRGSYALVDAKRHRPLRQRMALLNGAGPAAKAFYDFLRSPPARTIFRRYGFVLPGEGS